MAKLNWNSNANREYRLRNKEVVNTPNAPKKRKWDIQRAKKHSKVQNTENIISSAVSFGKFKGTLIKNVPTWWLEWAVLHIDHFQTPALAAELVRRRPELLA